MDDKRTLSEEELNQLIPEGQISLREYMAGADSMFVSEGVIPETGQRGIDIQTNIKEGMDRLVSVSEVTLEKMLQAGLSFEKKRALLQAVWDAHPDDPFIDALPAPLVTLTATLYLRENGLEEVKQEDIEAHRAPYLQFFRAYMDEWKAIGGETRKDQEEVIKELGQVLRDKGLIKSLIPAADRLEEMIRTTYPEIAIAPIDKVTKLAFAGGLTEQLQPLAMESRKSKRPVTTFASINFSAPQLQGLKGLSYYDRSVYNAICTLYARGGNEYITKQMIYQVMAGNEDAYLNPKQAADIGNSITKFMYGGVHIDATEEVKKHNISGSFTYDTNLLHAERGRFNLNGTVTECIHIIKPPVLLEYAGSKDQIANIPIMALATPVNNNSEVLALKAYLLDRIHAMRGKDPQRDISYSSIYNAVWGKESSSKETAGSSRVKKYRLRENTTKMLDHWTTEKSGALIKGYEEYKRGKNIAGIKISL